jgi:hypothetical protein
MNDCTMKEFNESKLTSSQSSNEHQPDLKVSQHKIMSQEWTGMPDLRTDCLEKCTGS